MNGRRWVCAGILACSLGACSLGRPTRQPTTYNVDPHIEETRNAAPRSEVLRVSFVHVAAPFAGSSLVYRFDDVRYVTDPYHAFVADSGAMFDAGMAEWLRRTGPFSYVVPPGSSQPAPYVLEVTVGDLYGDFRPGSRPAAVMSAQFGLIDLTGRRPKVAYERTIASRIELQKASPDALVRGYGAASLRSFHSSPRVSEPSLPPSPSDSPIVTSGQ